MNTIKANCQICGKEFNTTAYSIKTGIGKFCSRSCANVILNKQRSSGVLFRCQQCGKQIYRKQFEIKSGKHKFCSNKCKHIAMIKRQSRNCEICGKVFMAKVSNISKGYSKMCSMKCHGIHTSLRQAREKNPMWNGGITPALTAIRNSTRYHNWRMSIFLRDNFICQKCGVRGGKLHAHHIKSFSLIMDDIQKNLPLLNLQDAAMLYSPLWEISNGTTICEPCHKKEHKKAVN